MKINTLVRMHRAKLGYSQEDLANIFGVTKAMICIYETGTRNWSVKYLRRLVKELDIPQEDMIEAIKEDHAIRSKEGLAKVISMIMEETE